MGRRSPRTLTATRAGRGAILEIHDPKWTAFVAGHPDAGPFHQPAWVSLLAECYQYPAGVLVGLDQSGQIEFGLPLIEVARRAHRRWISLPFTDFCPPLLRPSVEPVGVVQEVVDDMRLAEGVTSIEIRDGLAQAGTWRSSQGFRHTLTLGAESERVYSGFHKSQVQRSIKRAAREGVTVNRVGSLPEFMDGFYRLHAATRRRLGVPLQTPQFFKLLWHRLTEDGLGFVLSACLDQQPVAAVVFLVANGQIVYKYSASDPKLPRLRGTHAVLWEAIQWGCSNGCRQLDFGRTEADNPGLRAFKLSWGAHEQPLEYTLVADRPPAPSRQRALKAAGVVIRHSPIWVAKALGRVAYRRTA